jgi:hypothetical protein
MPTLGTTSANGDDAVTPVTAAWPVAANRSRRRATFLRDFRHWLIYMKANSEYGSEDEPIGIVISRGSRHEHVPTVFAYVWAPAPEATDESLEIQAA